MKPSLPNRPLLFSPFLFLSTLLNLPAAFHSASLAPRHPRESRILYHDGPLLTGNVTLSVLWYGVFEEFQKEAILAFVESLNKEVSFEPSVAQWWNKVESHQLLMAGESDNITKTKGSRPQAERIKVKVVKQVDDEEYSVGKQLSSDAYLHLAEKAAAGASSDTVAAIFADRDVVVEDVCAGPCYVRGVVPNGKRAYMVVGNPGSEKCPAGRCLWPFQQSAECPESITIKSPNGDADTASKIVHFASALAATVTNPYSNGFHGGALSEEVGSACFGVFGTGAFPGYAGRTRMDPHNGVEFNAHGLNATKFLLPAIWDPLTSACWTTV